MRRVDHRRARAEAAGAAEELDRPHAVLGEALVHLARLLVRMDVEDETIPFRIAPDLLEPVGRAGAYRVGGKPDPHAVGAQRFDLAQVVRHRRLAQALAAAAPVRRVEEDEVDLCRRGRLDRCSRGLEAEVVELPDGDVACGQHLAVSRLVARAYAFGRLSLGLVPHELAPRPEVAALGAPAQSPLERVAVRVDEAGKRQHEWRTLSLEPRWRRGPSPCSLPRFRTGSRSSAWR